MLHIDLELEAGGLEVGRGEVDAGELGRAEVAEVAGLGQDRADDERRVDLGGALGGVGAGGAGRGGRAAAGTGREQQDTGCCGAERCGTTGVLPLGAKEGLHCAPKFLLEIARWYARLA